MINPTIFHGLMVTLTNHKVRLIKNIVSQMTRDHLLRKFVPINYLLYEKDLTLIKLLNSCIKNTKNK